MGKKGRGRDVSPTLNRTPLDESTKPSLCKIQGAEVLLPAAVPSWKTYEEALVGLEKLGFKDARFVPGFDTKSFCLQLQSLLTSLEVVDVSYALPTGPAGNHSVFPTIGHDLVGMSKRHKTRVYVLMRTHYNTPAFLGGQFYGAVANGGSIQKGAAVCRGRSACAALFVCNGQFITLPIAAIQSSVNVAARVAAAWIERDVDSFCCCICGESLVRADGDGDMTMGSFLVGSCDHVFHSHCIVARLNTQKTSCPVCDVSLPKVWARSARRSATLDELADKVREAVIADAAESVPDARLEEPLCR